MTLKLKTLLLRETTSKTQIKNGTRRFYDPIGECNYMSYASGYIRRKTKYSLIYQLNKTRKVIREYGWYPGKFIECTERILEANPNTRLEMIAKAAINYRKYLNKTA